MSVSMYVQPEPHSCCGPVFWRDLRAPQYVQLWLAVCQRVLSWHNCPMLEVVRLTCSCGLLVWKRVTSSCLAEG